MLQKWGWNGAGCAFRCLSQQEGQPDRDAKFLILVGLQAAAGSASTCKFYSCSCSLPTTPSGE